MPDAFSDMKGIISTAGVHVRWLQRALELKSIVRHTTEEASCTKHKKTSQTWIQARQCA